MNKKWTKVAKRFFAMFLCLAMVLPMLPQIVWAAGTGTGTMVADGIIASGIKEWSTGTTNSGIKLVPVTATLDGGNLVHSGHYAITTKDNKYLMSYDATGIGAGLHQTMTGSMKLDTDKASENAFYIDDNGNLIIDHGDRSEALWVLKQYSQAKNGNTLTHLAASIKPGTLGYNYSNDAYLGFVGKKLGFAAVYYGIEFQKGIYSAANTGVADNKEANGPWWPYTASSAPNRILNYYANPNDDSAKVNNGDMFIDSALGNGDQSNGSSYQNRRKVGVGYVKENDGSYSYFLYSYSEVKDTLQGHDTYRPELAFLYCDENGNWSIRRYYTRSDGKAAPGCEAFSKLFTGGSGVINNSFAGTVNTTEWEKLKVRLYKYEDAEGAKTVNVSGYSTYYTKAGMDNAAIVEAIQKNTMVYDKVTGQYIPCSGTTALVGHYYVDTTNWNLCYKSDDLSVVTIADLTVAQYTVTAGNASLGEAITSKNSSYASTLYVPAKDASGNVVSTDTPVTFTVKSGSSTVEVRAAASMLYNAANEHVNTSTVDLTGTTYDVKIDGTKIGTMKLYVANGTIQQQMPGYPKAGSVAVHKNGTTLPTDFSTNGVANIQLSAAGKPNENGVDVIVMLDLSSSMRRDANNNTSMYHTPYYTSAGVKNTSWTSAGWQNTRMYDMEESLKEMVTALQGSGVDVQIAIADFGDLDHYDFDGASILNKPSYLYPMLDVNGNKVWDNDGVGDGWLEFTNHLNYVMGSTDIGVNDVMSRPYNIWDWKNWDKSYAVNTKKIAESMWGRQESEIYTGGHTVSNAFSDIKTVNLGGGEDGGIIEKLRISNAQYLGTNYDIGMEYMYKIAYERKQQNIANGENREIVCVFMSDGAAMQYNYFSGSAHSNAWNEYLLGTPETLPQSKYTWSLEDKDGNGATDSFENGTIHPVAREIVNALQQQLHTPNNGHSNLGKTFDADKAITSWYNQCTCGRGGNGAYFVSCMKSSNNVTITWQDIFSIQVVNDSNPQLHGPEKDANGNIVGGKGSLRYRLEQLGLTFEAWKNNKDQGYILRKVFIKHLTYTAGEHTSNAYETYSPFYYFYNTEGQNWWAEAIKGDTDEIFPVINKYAKGGKSFYGASNPSSYNGEPGCENNFSGETTKDLALDGKPYISGFQGLGLKIYTVGFALKNDSTINVNTMTAVLGKIATESTEAYCFKADDKDELADAMINIAKTVTLGASRLWFTDTLGIDYDLLTETTVTDRSGGQYTVNVKPVISVKLYSANNDGSPQYELRTLETIEFMGGQVAKSTIYNDDGTVSSTKDDVWADNGLVSGANVFFNTNKESKVELTDLFGTGLSYKLAPETFFWRIGNMPDEVIVLEYQVYLSESMAGKYDPYPNRTSHDTNESATLHYVDYLGNNVVQDKESPVYTWDPLEGVSVVVDYGLPVEMDVLEHSKFNDVFTYNFVDRRAAAPIAKPELYAVKKGKISQDDYINIGTNKPLGEGYTLVSALDEDGISGDYGTLTVSGNNLIYTPNSTNDKLEMAQYELFAYVVKDQDTDNLYYCYASVFPATIMYYEDNHVSYQTYTKNPDYNPNEKDSKQWLPDNGTGSWTIGTDPTSNQDLDLVGERKRYGYDSHYTPKTGEASMNGHSMGAASHVSVNEEMYATIKFSFTGTGFDIISRTGSDTGLILIDVFKAGTTTRPTTDAYLTSTEVVDTYYGYKLRYYEIEYTYSEADKEWLDTQKKVQDTDFTSKKSPNAAPSSPKNGDKYYEYGTEWVPNPVSDKLYQIPVVKHSGLPYDSYDVTIKVAYNKWLDHPAPGDGVYDFYLDAIRIYDPAGVNGANDDTGLIEYVYEQDGEAKPTFVELRNEIISADTFGNLTHSGGTVSGIAYIDNANLKNSPAPTISDYHEYGSKNEIYLLKDQAIVFTLDNPEKLRQVHLAMKSVNTDANVLIQYYDKESNTLEDFKTINVKTATDLYYDISKLAGKDVVIKNTSDCILSITNIKTTFTDHPTTQEVEQLLTVSDYEDLFAAMAADNGTDQPGQNEPGQNPDQNKPEQDQPGQEEVPGTGDIGIEMLAVVMMTACVMMLGVLTILQSCKKNEK